MMFFSPDGLSIITKSRIIVTELQILGVSVFIYLFRVFFDGCLTTKKPCIRFFEDFFNTNIFPFPPWLIFVHKIILSYLNKFVENHGILRCSKPSQARDFEMKDLILYSGIGGSGIFNQCKMCTKISPPGGGDEGER